MADTASDILTRVATNVNGVASLPAGSELTAWESRLNEAYQEWASSYEPQVLIKQYTGTIAQSGISMAIPDDFKEKFAGFINVGGSLQEEFDPVEATITTGSYVKWGGNKRDGYYLGLSKATYSTVSVTVPYHSRPTSLSTLTSIPVIPDPEFLVARTTEKVMLQRSQPDYVEFQVKADLLLQRMVASEVSQDIQRNKGIRSVYDYNNFTFGED